MHESAELIQNTFSLKVLGYIAVCQVSGGIAGQLD